MSTLPSAPWVSVKIDFYGPLPSGDYVLEVVDEYSRWVELEFVRSTSAKSTVPKLDKIFAAYGIPTNITTDNGPPFNSEDFKIFVKYLGIKHSRITPFWPQSNSSAENFNRRIRKVVQSSKLEQKNWKQELYRFLRNYRATPHSSTGKSPSELMFPGRIYRTRLPEIEVPYDDTLIREKDFEAKRKMKMYADSRANVKPSQFQIDDLVLVKQKKINKLTPPFTFYTFCGTISVTADMGPSITTIKTELIHRGRFIILL